MGLWSFLFGKRNNYVREGKLTLMDQQTIRDGWLKIEEQLALGKPANLRSAVIDADKLTDFALQKMYPGEEKMADRLRVAKAKFINHYDLYDGLWFAHKVRNELVHNVNFDLPSVEVRNIIDKFKAGLEQLGVF